ncbi:hypothetical protein SJA_C1-35080 [Sphingobium indicum UT26S]|uniref:Uncharacterized protein n=1 Tax=Sphingobium indicum (strain DSM 16413 / CCM 7287 / MTCC 6362 / UT26 / NBRC 101211 / UT26S) TaxID=452662 RepID=D4Z6W0_SPHIU|nr:hypothetical protein SJA_C1-35080 [Sphingobium indicum UT26S]
MGRDLAQGGAKIVDFQNRRAATLKVVSTGSAESRYLQPGLGQIPAQTKRPPLRGHGTGASIAPLKRFAAGAGFRVTGGKSRFRLSPWSSF